MKRFLLVTFALALAGCGALPGDPAAPGRQLLMEGSLDGWTVVPGGTWTFEDGVLVGRNAKDEPRHGLLLSDETFDDFVVEIRYRAVRGNSGLYFRSEPIDGAVGVHGFQAEIDAQRDAGGLYETGGRAWVVKPSPELVAACFRPGEWNTMRVEARGADVRVLVNGVVTAELEDDPGRRSGHFGLQLHGGQDMEVRIAHVVLLPLD